MFNEFTWLFLIIFFISFPFLLLLWLFLSSYYYIWSNWVITFQVNMYVLCISVNTSHKSMYGGICRIRILLSITNYNSGEIGHRMPSSPLTSDQTLVQSLYNIYIVISQNTFLPTLDVAGTWIFISYLPLGITGNKQWLNRMDIF